MKEMPFQRDYVPILMYHSISSHASRKFQPFAVPPAFFADQMAYLYQEGYTPITVSHLVSAWSQQSTRLPEKPVVLTFDDGFADFFTTALPILKHYRFTATLYVSTGFVNGTSRWLSPEKEVARVMLTWKQLVEISMSGIECGGHSHSHPQLDILSSRAAREEISQCKMLLEEHLGQKICSFAYTFGYNIAQVRQSVQAAGYTSACAVRYALCSRWDDTFALPRLMVDASMNKDKFALLLADHASVDHASSPIKAAYGIYAHARTSLWRIARRYTTLGRRRYQENPGSH